MSFNERVGPSLVRQMVLLGQEGARIVPQHIRTPEPTRYAGSARDICRAIVEKRWNGVYFEAGESPINQFWIRDFGFVLADLMRAGYEEQARQSLQWAMQQYALYGRVSTTIAPNSLPFNVYSYAADSMVWLLQSIKTLQAQEILDSYGDFLQAQVDAYVAKVYDPKTNGVRRDRHFPTIKDMITRRATSSSNAFLLKFQELLDNDFADSIENPLCGIDLRSTFLERFWNGKHFIDNDSGKRPQLSGDTAIIPFMLRIVSDDKMLASTIDTIRDAGFDHPFALRYHVAEDHDDRDLELIAQAVAPNFQGTTVWSMLGPRYIQLAARVDPAYAKAQLQEYEQWILREGTYVEVFEPDGRQPYRGRPFYHGAHTGMIWAAEMLELL